MTGGMLFRHSLKLACTISSFVVLGILLGACASPGAITATTAPLVATTAPTAPPATATPVPPTVAPPTDTPIPPTSTVAPTPTSPYPLGQTRTDPKGIEQVWVPAGCFLMGTENVSSLKYPQWAASEQPQHEVCLTAGYWIDKYEVINAAFRAFVDDGGYLKEAYWSEEGWAWLSGQLVDELPASCVEEVPDHPRACVTWYEAEAYARWRGGQLPTEAQWEYAARGPQSFTYPWGNKYDNDRTNLMDSTGLVPVGSYPEGVSWVGAHDMAGNVMEWVQDWLDVGYYKLNIRDDPPGPETGTIKIEKGGWWGADRFFARSAYRHFEDPPDYEDHHIGFRVVFLDEGLGEASVSEAPVSPPPLSPGEVTFTTEDGVQLAGTVFGQGTTAVVLAHMLPVDQTSWHPFAQVLAEKGFTALAFDFRGYGGSGGSKDYSLLDKDVRAAIAFLRDHGFQRVVCIGASMGGTACGKVTHEPGLVGLVIISSPLVMDPPLMLRSDDFTDLAYPKLFIGSKDDQPYTSNLRMMFDWSPQPKRMKTFGGSAHGTYLFEGEHKDEFFELLVGFLTEIENLS